MAPKQITIIPVNLNDNLEYAKEIYEGLWSHNFRVKLDDRDERLNKKIREAQISKSKYQIILGENESKTKTISYRKYGETDTHTVSLDDFVMMLNKLRANYE